MQAHRSEKIGWVDSHAHLGDASILPQVDAVLARARQAGVEAIVDVATDEASLDAGRALVARNPRVFLAAAVHPHEVAKEGDHFFPLVVDMAERGALVAIGETGLDYHYEYSDRAAQAHWFIEHLRMARRYSLPVIVHCREAFNDFFDIVDREYPTGVGIVHCFTGSLSEAEELLKRGWNLSLSGIVTFPKCEELRAVARRVPLDRLLLETDAPWLAPKSRRGKTNEPSFLVETAEAVAAAKGVSVDVLAHATTANARRCFRLSGFDDD